jgi:glycosyltransferase involved in cell wall biosynthesis
MNEAHSPRLILRHPGLISVVIPAYNEASRITRCVHEVHETLSESGADFEVVVVDDGSQDQTLTLAQIAAEALQNVRVIGYPKNLGKGYALVEGAKEARGDLVLFVDADLEVHPRQLALLYGVLVGFDADVVIGSKLHRSSTIDYPLKRRVLSLGYYALVRMLFRLPVRDTQTGLKLFKAEVLRRVAGRLLVKRFAFDLEALAIVNRLGYRIAEAPVVVTREREFPRVGGTDAFAVAWDTLAVWYRMYLRRFYDKVGPEADAKAAAGEVAMAPEGASVLARELEERGEIGERERSQAS